MSEIRDNRFLLNMFLLIVLTDISAGYRWLEVRGLKIIMVTLYKYSYNIMSNIQLFHCSILVTIVSRSREV